VKWSSTSSWKEVGSCSHGNRVGAALFEAVFVDEVLSSVLISERLEMDGRCRVVNRCGV